MTTNYTITSLTTNRIDNQATALTRVRYQRIASIYDLMEGLLERRVRPWRRKLWSLARGPRLLEVGVGTGKNIEYWPVHTEITGIDLTPGMLDIARRRAMSLEWDADLRLGDVQSLEFAPSSFDTAVATCVFCSVPDPIQGLRELGRVVRPGGQILLLEHVRIDRPVIGRLMDVLAPLIVRINGANINRRTVENVGIAGLCIDQAENLDDMGMFKLIVAHPAH